VGARQPRHDPLLGCGLSKDRHVQVYALASSQSLHETLDLFLTREAAEAELAEILVDKPDWKDVIRVVSIELDERKVSAN
jgi:hypothetical protein